MIIFKRIELNPDFHQLNNDEKFYDSKQHRAFKTYWLLGRINLDLGNYNEANAYLSKAWEIYDQHETEFDKNNNLINDKMNLCYEAGICHTSRRNFDKGLSLLMKSLEIIENKRPNDLQKLLFRLYHISWNLLISGKLNDALSFTNRAVDILNENDDERYNALRDDQQFVVKLQNKFVSPSLLLHQYRYNSKLTSEGKPDVEITSEVTLLLEDMLSEVEDTS